MVFRGLLALALSGVLLSLLSTAPRLVNGAAVEIQPQAISYAKYKVFRVAVGDELDRVNSVVSRLSLKTWKGAPRRGAVADIVVPPDRLDAFTRELAGMESTTLHEDLGQSIAAEALFDVYAAGSANSSWFSSYHAFAEHVQFMRDLESSFPDNAEVLKAGESLNGNPILGIHISGSGGKNATNKPAIVFHGTVHAREWIGTMVVEYLAYTLLSNYASSAEIRSFVDKYDFYIFPVVNPDGFIYTQTNDRLWRKNRQSTDGSNCRGHDINRNWDFQWSVTGGASTNPCADDYKGESPADAPETVVLSRWLKETKARQGLKLFIDYHSYSQLFMTPYGYSCTAVAPKDAELQRLARGAVAAIKAVHGVSYKSGPICTTIYQATGSSVDYVNDVVGADYTFTVELRDTGNYGFVLPASQIVPSGEEAFAGVKYLLQNMK